MLVMRFALALIASVLLAQATVAPGKYTGTWSGGAANGDFFLTLAQDAGEWKAEVNFTLAGTEVPTKITHLKLDGNKLEVTYQFDLGGNNLESAIQGLLKDGAWDGTYKTRVPATDTPVDEGTWKASKSSEPRA